jgi:5'-deoxynucleotidase YfbR-like HD superfamily hydrolase
MKKRILRNKERKRDGINNFIIKSFDANFNYRFRNTPYMATSYKKGKRESIAGHMWGVSLLWFCVKESCPKLASLVSSEKVFEILLSHDLGEIINGDSSIYQQYSTKGKDKHQEKRDLRKIIKDLPSKTQNRLLKYFDKFEDVSKTKDLEILTARLMDSLHGHLFVFAHGNDLEKMSEVRNTVTIKHFNGIVKQLLRVLDGKGEVQAKKEITALVKNHLDLWKKINVIIDPDSYFN